MGKRVEIPKYCTLSGRFSEEENKKYREMAEQRNIPISKMVREAMALWEAKEKPG